MLTYDTKMIVEELRKLHADIKDMKQMMEQQARTVKKITDANYALSTKLDNTLREKEDQETLLKRLSLLESEVQLLKKRVERQRYE